MPHLTLNTENLSVAKLTSDKALYKVRDVLVRHDAAPRVEGVLHRVLQQVGDVRRVDVSKTEQPSREVGGIVIRTEHTPKLLVEYTLHRMPATEAEYDYTGQHYHQLKR